MGCCLRAILLLLAAALAARATTYYVTIAGLGGEPDYDSQFVKWASELQHELEKNGPDARVTTLAGNAATRAAVQQSLSRLAGEVKPEDEFAIFLIGHGTFDGSDYKFNLPGPDLSAGELATLLNRIPAGRQLVVNMTSCSGASIPALARKGRILITATKSGTEKNATVFPRYWIDALHDPAADTDKNGTLSTLEVYRYTAQKTAAYFESEKLLATEHPALTDNGTANAVRDPGAENGQGLLAARFAILLPAGETVKTVAPEKQKLVSKKEELEAQIDRLKYQKAAMTPDEYRQQLTALLLELARTQAEIDK
jgi:Peptidase C13 family